MNSIHEQKYKIESEFHIIIRRLVHPQAKDYYDEERENKIIVKSKICFLKCGIYSDWDFAFQRHL